MNKKTKDLFLKLSKVLTGIEGLDPNLTESFYDRLLAVFPTEMHKLLAAFEKMPGADPEKEVSDGIINDPKLGKELLPLVKETINIWYLGSFYMPNPDRLHMPPTDVDQYTGQQMFPLIKAPVRAYSNLEKRQYGYWQYKPQGA
jgi:hypothetical protein